MSLVDSIRNTLVPIHREGYPFIAGFAGVTVVLGYFWEPLFWIGLILTAWCIYFYRDPQRVTPTDDRLVISPADGIVSAVGPAVPPRELDYSRPDKLPWRLQPEIAGGGYFYDLAPHQLDLLQDMFGVILDAQGICANRGGLYAAEDSVSACFRFENGLPGSGSWCFVAHESAREDRIEIIGNQGSLLFSVFDYQPIILRNSDGEQQITVPNPPYVQFPIIRNVVEHLQGLSVCTCTSVSATPVNWVMDRILGKI